MQTLRKFDIRRATKQFGVVSAAALMASLSFTAPADAHRRNYAHTHNGTGAAVAAGIAGIIIGGAIANSNRNRGHVTHCHGRYCHDHHFNRGHYHHRSGAVRYQRPRYHAGPRVVIRGNLSGRHYRWCDAKYRSYRARDNSFQPYHGGRKQCVSPYY